MRVGSRVPPMHAQFIQYLVAGSSQECHSVYRLTFFLIVCICVSMEWILDHIGQFWGPTYFIFLVQGCFHFCVFPSFLARSGKLGLDVTSVPGSSLQLSYIKWEIADINTTTCTTAYKLLVPLQLSLYTRCQVPSLLEVQ